MSRHGVINSFLALAIGVALQPISAQTQQTAAPPRQPGQLPPPAASAKPTSPATATAKPVASKDLGWPRMYTDGTATIAVHQPQVDDWKDFAILEARSAVEVQENKSAKKVLAAVHWKSETDTNVGERTVVLKRPEIMSFRVPGETEEKNKEFQALTLRLLPAKTDAVALDRVLAYLDVSRVPTREVKVSTEPPPIMVSTSPAILVMLDGPPIIGPVQGTKLSYVVNTNWDLLKEDDEFYLLNSPQWLTAKALEGPWKITSKLPKEFKKIPADENWADVRKALNPAKPPEGAKPPWVYLSEKPSELILITGDPQFKPIPDTRLSEVTNTKSLLFYDNLEKTYYFLTSGRWFRNKTLRGNWEFASDKLPPDFANIPPNHPKASVRVSVPGTDEARDAVLLANVPQSAVVNRKQAAAQAAVKYVGNPEFKAIENTTLQYATNTPEDVIKYGDKYYLLQTGVWFVSGSATGPWEVADMVPQEIYKIPPESPKHNTTYVYVTGSDSETVTTAQTAGYLGLTVGFGVAMWGTGWYYPPYYYYGPMYPYPVYWGYPYHTYGAAAWYNPATGFYGRGAVAYGPYGGYGRAAAYNPATGTYARRAGAYGPYQAGMATSAYNPRTGSWGAGYRYANPYQGWGQGVVQRGNQWARGGYYYDDRGAIGGVRTSEGGGFVAAGNGDNRGFMGRTSEGDIYAGKDGNIYKRDQNGNWSQRGQNGWTGVDTSNLSAEQQQRMNDAKSRQAERQGQRPGQTSASQRQPGQLANSERVQPGTLATDRGSGSRQPGQLANSGSFGQARSAGASTSEMRSGVNRDVMSGLDRDASARSSGNRNHSSWQNNRGSSSRGSYGGGYGGGMRRGGGGRRR
jgi:hypothetical protein